MASPGYQVALPVLFAALSLIVVKRCVYTRPLRWFDPLVWMVLPLVVMFVARPLAVLAAGQLSYRGFDLSKTYDRVMLSALAGLTGLCVGYIAPWPAALGRRTPSLPAHYDEVTITKLAYGLVGLGVAGYGVFLAKSGISLASIISLGLPQGTTAGSQQATAYFYLAPLLMLPATLLLFRAGLKTRNAYLLAVSGALLLVMLAAFAPTGARFSTLMFVGAFVLYALLRYQWRPPPWLVGLGILAVLVFVQATAGATAGPQSTQSPGLGAAIIDTAAHPARSAEQLVLGPTIEMFDGLGVEVQVVPSDLGYHPLTSITTVLSAPIPRSIWSGKPYVSDAGIDTAAFGVTSGSHSVAFSVFGEFYYDSGWVGVFVGMALVGALLRFISEYVSRNRTNELGVLLLAVSLPLIPVLARGNLSATLAQALFVVFPIPIVAFLSRERGVV